MRTLEKSLEDTIGKSIYEDIQSGYYRMQPTVGRTRRGNMIGYVYTNDKNATIRIQAFTKDEKVNALFVITVVPAGGSAAEITGKYARKCFHAANDYKKSYYTKTKVPHAPEVVDFALEALGIV